MKSKAAKTEVWYHPNPILGENYLLLKHLQNILKY